MVATAAYLTDYVLPPLPVRHWVLTVPKRPRYFLRRDADLQAAALRLFLRVVEQCLRAQSWFRPRGALGAVALIHCFGFSLNAQLHFHCVVIDRVFEPTAMGVVVIREATSVDADAIVHVQARVRRALAAQLGAAWPAAVG